MATRYFQLASEERPSEVIREAAQCLRGGGLVVFPTETVYGVAADAMHAEGLARLREVKQRSEEKPFTVHLGSRAEADRFVPDMPAIGRRLIRKAWPGPLTLIFDVPDPTRAEVIRESSPDHVAAMYREGTIGLRCPDDAVSAELLSQVGSPVVAASANPAGAPPPNEASEAMESLNGKVDIVLDAGRTRYSQASTIVRILPEGLDVVREGVLDERTLQRMNRVHILLVCTGNTCRSPMAEGILKKLLADRLGTTPDKLADQAVHVESAGTSAMAGLPASAEGVEVLRGRGIDISEHRSRPATLELLRRADYIFTLTAAHREQILLDDPSLEDRCSLLDARDIADPIGGDASVYAQCADQIENALRKRLEEIHL